MGQNTEMSPLVSMLFQTFLNPIFNIVVVLVLATVLHYTHVAIVLVLSINIALYACSYSTS